MSEEKIRALENDMMLVRDGTIVGKVNIAKMLKGTTTKAYGSVDVWGDKGDWCGINFFDKEGSYKGTFLIRLSDYMSGFNVEGVGWKWRFSGGGVLDQGTVPIARVTDHNATAHPVSVLKLSTGSYSENISQLSLGTPFTTNKYAHQIEVKGESTDIKIGQKETGATQYNLYGYAVTTSWVALKYAFCNENTGAAQYAYAQWSYHSASKQAIWGVWNKEEKRLTCVLVEEDEGYCKLYPELKGNQKLIKIKNPKKHEKLFAWDIMKLSKEKKIKETELEEIKGGK